MKRYRRLRRLVVDGELVRRRAAGEPVLDQAGAVDRVAVDDQEHRAADLAEQALQEGDEQHRSVQSDRRPPD